MDLLKVVFPISGIETYIFIPPLVSFLISFFTSMAGISGAFLILPLQMSMFGFTTPSVSSTNFLYNVVGTPGGVFRYIREGRMSWPLAGCIIAGTLPGVLAGYYIRVKYLPDPQTFKFFVGVVLLYVGVRLFRDVRQKRSNEGGMAQRLQERNLPENTLRISNVSYSLSRIEYDFMGERISFSVPAMFALSLVVGVIGGIYGIGGGAIIAPFCITFFRLPVYTVAGAALMGTFVTSISGVAIYSLIPLNNGLTAPPDWPLGLLFGIGGFFGMYLGAKTQKHIPEKVIKVILALIIVSVSAKYVWQFIAG
ncbi:MAG: sulfite exporter TauE/SafE family protein [Nitrospirota bacterium]|nr:sulfite exporter TauE/SafE family protein [Nitrospirota bacterium]